MNCSIQKDENFSLTDIPLQQLWLIYRALDNYTGKGHATRIAKSMAQEIYAKKLIEFDEPFDTSESSVMIAEQNERMMGALTKFFPAEATQQAPKELKGYVY
jgi:hypothetical protein